ncbi:hypothetical protein Kpho02_59750 [Kitasatospora phosalacinea]|uniref:Uncharacterized protein n=1 Tax=Kitasatospora phosalacinea TaxID=2065 RepID=A0A9W6QDW3_9ACTN|nr:hypothetical protein [Kitasatospora phosalacinea]GLW73676.1 hypothetical protein Kpho02_59750 [Kitasatospora phosalacinea]
MIPDSGTSHPLDPSAVILLEPGYVPFPKNGTVVALPTTAQPGDTTCVPALIDGQATAVPVFDVAAQLAVLDARLAEHRRAIAAMNYAPAPAPVADPAAEQGLPLVVRQCVLYGSIASLVAGGAVWMLGAAVAEIAPHADEIGDLLKWAAVLVAAVVLGVAGLLGKLRSLPSGTSGSAATANGEHSTATGTVLTLSYRPQHHTTTIGRQSAGWRGSITNSNG